MTSHGKKNLGSVFSGLNTEIRSSYPRGSNVKPPQAESSQIHALLDRFLPFTISITRQPSYNPDDNPDGWLDAAFEILKAWNRLSSINIIGLTIFFVPGSHSRHVRYSMWLYNPAGRNHSWAQGFFVTLTFLSPWIVYSSSTPAQILSDAQINLISGRLADGANLRYVHDVFTIPASNQ